MLNRIFDKDGSGSISQAEMTSIVTHLYHLMPDKEREQAGTPEQFSQRIMNETDKNKVRLISRQFTDYNYVLCSRMV